MNKWIRLSCFIILFTASACSFDLLADRKPINEMDLENQSKETKHEKEREKLSVSPKKRTSAPTVTTVSFSAIGDVLIHSQIYKDAQFADGSYNFQPMFAQVKLILQEADLAMANQESVIGGRELGISSYPLFNSPFEVADALKDAGIDIVSTANNHSLDRGEKGILNAISHYEKIGMLYVGSYKDEIDANTMRIQTINGIKIGFLSYTYGTNGIPLPKDKPYLVNLIDKQKISLDLNNMDKLVDVTIVNMHWGQEYHQYPNEEQKQLAQFLVDNGADLIIGHHPHVLQPLQWMEGKRGNHAMVVYSLGNFLSGQKGGNKDIGGIFSIDLIKLSDENNTTMTLANPRLTPTYVTKNEHQHYYVSLLENLDKAKSESVMKHMFQWIETEKVTNLLQ